MKKFLKSFIYAFNGITYAIKTQLSFQIECTATIAVILLGYYLKLNKNEWLWVALAISVVLILELLNTAIEVLVDLVSPEQNPKAGAIKDLASGAVLIAALFSIAIGLFIFLPKFC